MTDDQNAADERETFAWLSNEYAQAIQALRAIENQSSTLMLLGVADELGRFVEQFLEMATRARAMAEDCNEPHFVEWFGELIEKAEAMRDEIARHHEASS